MNSAVGQFFTVLMAIVGVAIVATLVSKNSQTPQVFSSFFRGFGGAISAAEGPVMGGGSIGLGGSGLSSIGGLLGGMA